MSGQRPGSTSSRRQGPERPAQAGTRRPRSPDPPVPSGSKGKALESTTKSPHTDRVIKKRTTSGSDATPSSGAIPTSPYGPPPAFHLVAYQPPSERTRTPTKNTSTSSAAPRLGDVDLLEQIRVYLGSAVATATCIPATSDLKTADVAPLITLIEQLRAAISPEEPSPPPPSSAAIGPQRPSYAKATKASPRHPPAREAHAPSAAQARSTPKPQPRTPRPPSRRAAPPRLIIDMDGAAPGSNLSFIHPDTVCKAINDALPLPARVSAMTFSRVGNIILHPSAPACTARMLIGHRQLIWKCVQSLLCYKDPDVPDFYTSDPWHKVVAHEVMPTGERPYFAELLDEIRDRNDLSSPTERIGSIRYLTSTGPGPRGYSIRVDFLEEVDARRFLREGMFLYGSHCRVSRYKPRKRRGGQPDRTT
ncbi:hypothetical protein C8R46DRAFT_1209193 [Mycena filopes]|nr:hypothetical protein C8R46DRAFT_1209193 [Mycena filopes]